MQRPDCYRLVLLAGLLLSSGAGWAQAYYLCQDPKTGKKVGQDKPCQTGGQINTYAPASAAELKARDEAARQSKREFERAHPGTYRPEEYMTAEEYAEHQTKVKEYEAERERRESRQAIEAASRKAAQAEQRAIEAEAAARQAEARAKAAAEEAAARNAQPQIQMLMPRVPVNPPRPGNCGRPGSREECFDDPSRPAPRREATPSPAPSPAPGPTLQLSPRPL